MTQKPTLQVALPISRAGEVVAILSTTFFPERLVGLLKEGLPPGPFSATILDRNGIIIARSSLPEQYIGKPLKALAEGSKERQGSLDTFNAQGVPIFVHYRRPELSGWVIAAAVERSALTAPLTRSLYVLGGTAAVLALLALGVAAWVGLKILRAQRALVEAAESVGAGRVIAPPTTPLKETDRIGHALAEASHSIAEQAGELLRTNQQLETRVEARTRELAAKTALLETTLDTMTQGLIVIDGAERIAVCNRQARTLLDLPDALMDTRPTIDELLAFKNARGEFALCSNQSFSFSSRRSATSCRSTNGSGRTHRPSSRDRADPEWGRLRTDLFGRDRISLLCAPARRGQERSGGGEPGQGGSSLPTSATRCARR